MTIALNLLPIAIAVVFLFWAYARYKKDKEIKRVIKPTLVMLASLFLYFQFQPSYMPKGEIRRSSIPTFEQKQVEIKNNLSSPMSASERDKRRDQQYKEKIEFVKQRNDE